MATEEHENTIAFPLSPPQRPLRDISINPSHLSGTPRRRKPPYGTRKITPITPDTSQTTEPSETFEVRWPRMKRHVPRPEIISVVKQIFGYEPLPWQMDVFEKIAEGNNTISIAGTGYGKSLIFALLAIAAELSSSEGTVIVICPLKSLEKDQVDRFNMAKGITRSDGSVVQITAVAINEDNKDDSIFKKLKQGAYRICYASPECLLRNNDFKKLFRWQGFCKRVLALVVDEAHVIEDWKDTFRKDYSELGTLRVMAGMDIPWAALTAACSTATFEVIFNELGMAGARPFWGIDMGADRKNVSQRVQRMEFSKSSMADLFAFIPVEAELKSPEDLEKTIFYFQTRSAARKAMRTCRRLLPPAFRRLVTVYTATNSEEHKKKVVEDLKSNETRWVFATLALGMGLDIPDIGHVVIFGVCPLSEAYQKGGRAGRDPSIKAKMTWLIEDWAFEQGNWPGTSKCPMSEKDKKKEEENRERRAKLDSGTQGYLRSFQTGGCLRQYTCTHFRPQPNLPGFPGYTGPAIDTYSGDVDSEMRCVALHSIENVKSSDYPSLDDNCSFVRGAREESKVTWLVQEQELAMGSDCGCNSQSCRVNGVNEPVGRLSDRDREIIHSHLLTLKSPSTIPPMTHASAPTTQLRVSKQEREALQDSLTYWRDFQWRLLCPKYHFYTRSWVLSDEDLKRIVDKAHVVLNAPVLDIDFLRSISKSLPASIARDELIKLLGDFCEERKKRDAQEKQQRAPKRRNISRYSSAAPNNENDPFSTQAPVPSQRSRHLFAVNQTTAKEAAEFMEFTWQA